MNEQQNINLNLKIKNLLKKIFNVSETELENIYNDVSSFDVENCDDIIEVFLFLLKKKYKTEISEVDGLTDEIKKGGRKNDSGK